MNKLTLIALLLSASIFGFANKQVIDQEKSKVTFEISNMKIKTVNGSFGGMKGTVNFNPKDLKNSSFNVCVDAATVNTDNTKRDDHLRTEDFFFVSKYPVVCFESESIQKTSSGYVVKGKLTLHGVTKQITVPFTFENNVLKGTGKINRLDYGVGVETGTAMVGDEVTITVVCVLK